MLNKIKINKLTTANTNWLPIFLPLISICLILILYFIKFNDGFSLEQSVWGAFGDYVGGILNPILTFITIIYLLKSHSLQIHETREIQNENRLSINLRSLEQINQDLLNFYEKKNILGHNYHTYLEILETLLNSELLNLDLENSSKIENNEDRLNKMFKNVFARIPSKNINTNDIYAMFQSRSNKSIIEKFKISKLIIKQITEIVPNHPITELFLIDHEVLNALFTINSKIYKEL
ncbi:hypothetical protein [Leptospira mtsangambouensis]|uniref:hypothetical protein n=1 Tax=Leptospira mtsangambouensis TaxID=2484912 RepID=UPI001EEC93C0|nr:hypothetical protein [Leptospira mtsangambouensis]MCG6142782.1 hypothetical protein [Leptospira mtsangambouensis]